MVPLRRAGFRRLAIRLKTATRASAPHKVKAAVSGCVRECAEAQERFWPGGHGARLQPVCVWQCARPRHADLLAADIDEATAIIYIDRFLMYYIMTVID